MTLPSSGQLSFDDIRAEFGGTYPIVMSDYYAGAASGFVPAGTSGTNGAVPSSGPLSVSNFYGTTKVPLSITINPTDQFRSGTTISTTFNLTTVTVTGGTATSYTWSFQNVQGGAWSITSGQGTASARASVTGVPIGGIAEAEFNCAVVVNGVTYNISALLDYTRS